MKKRKKFIELYNLVQPLMEKHLVNEARNLADDEDKKFWLWVSTIGEKDSDICESKHSVWSNAFNPFLRVFRKTLQKQIEALTNHFINKSP